MAETEANENPISDPSSDAEATSTDFEAQYKGLQRTLERERKRNAAGIKTEELQATLDLVRQEMQGLSQAVASIADSETGVLLENLKGRADEALLEIQQDTKQITEVYELEAEHDLNIDEIQ